MHKYLIGIIALIFWASCEQSVEFANYSTGEDSLYIVENYDKLETYITMRDGVRLFTAIYSPKDKSEDYPIILYRTPYSLRPYGTTPDAYRTSLGPSSQFARDGYIFVYQDVRGAYMSEGDFVNMTPHIANKESDQDVDESTDTFDTIEWLISNIEGNNGKVGQWGISYPGFYTSAGMIDSHPALVAASPQAPIADWWYDDFHHNGAFFLNHAFNFFANFGRPRPAPRAERVPRFDHNDNSAYDFFSDLGPISNVKEKYFGDSIKFWNELASHPNYDEFWQKRNILPHLKNVNCAVLTVGGWYDAEDLYGPLATYRTIEQNNPSIYNGLVMGPWSHGAWARTDGSFLGNVHFGSYTSELYNKEIIYPFFRYHLKGDIELNLPEAYVFETGTNQWRKFDSWPPENLIYRNLFLHKGKRLAFRPPRETEFGMDEYISDPYDPIPYVEDDGIRMAKEYMTDDQSFVNDRDDILFYLTEPLEENVTIAGPLEVNLVISTNQSAADFIVKLIDVYPETHPPYPHQPNKTMGDYHQMVRSEVLRGRFRNDASTSEPFVPNEQVEIKIELLNILHTFKKGHKIMVQIQSTWFPLVDINPQKYVDNIFEADSTDFVKARHRVFRSGVQPSYISFGTL
ncbi:MAG: CocE/NonD family hydrolase [Bacteroidota bacterium]